MTGDGSLFSYNARHTPRTRFLTQLSGRLESEEDSSSTTRLFKDESASLGIPDGAQVILLWADT